MIQCAFVTEWTLNRFLVMYYSNVAGHILNYNLFITMRARILGKPGINIFPFNLLERWIVVLAKSGKELSYVGAFFN